MLPMTKNRSIQYEEVPKDHGSSFTFRECDWSHYPFNWHYHPEVELTLIVQGRGMRFVGDSVAEFTDGDLCLLGSNTPHCWALHKDAAPGARSLVVQFRPDEWGEAFWKLPEFREIAKLLAAARRGLEVLGAARREVEKLFVMLQQEPTGSLRRFDTLLEMLQSIARSPDTHSLAARVFEAPSSVEANGKLGKILAYIHAHLGPDLTQGEVARAVRLSPAAFSQFFRRSLGASYVNYVNEIKIRNASRALIDTDQSITEIAFAAGFNNLSHFNTQFQRFRHLSPRAFRQQALAAERAGVPMDATRTTGVTPESTVATFERDVTVHGKGTAFEGVRLGTEEPRPWLKHFAVCPALARHGIVHAGLTEAHAPYQIVRRNQNNSYFLTCFGGRGQVLVEGKWRTIRPGLACLLPAHATHTAFEALPGEAWRFAYVCYEERPEHTPRFSASSPVVAEFNPELLRLAIQGLTEECRNGTGPAQESHWLELMQGYVEAFLRPSPNASRLPDLWKRVASRLQENWTPEALAREAECSSEALRQLCIKELGRSPLEQLTSLRMHRATELLGGGKLLLREVALAVGYADPLVFSNAFKSIVGCRPTEYGKRVTQRRVRTPQSP